MLRLLICIMLYDIYFAKNGKKPEIKEEEVNAPDLVAVPSEKTPYENFRSEVFTNSLDKKYYVLLKLLPLSYVYHCCVLVE